MTLDEAIKHSENAVLSKMWDRIVMGGGKRWRNLRNRELLRRR